MDDTAQRGASGELLAESGEQETEQRSRSLPYWVAVSVTGEGPRAYAQELVDRLAVLLVGSTRIYYDRVQMLRDEGEDVTGLLRKVFEDAVVPVVLVSQEYFSNPNTFGELTSMLFRWQEDGDSSARPVVVLMDQVNEQLPEPLSKYSYLRKDRVSAYDLADHIASKLTCRLGYSPFEEAWARCCFQNWHKSAEAEWEGRLSILAEPVSESSCERRLVESNIALAGAVGLTALVGKIGRTVQNLMVVASGARCLNDIEPQPPPLSHVHSGTLPRRELEPCDSRARDTAFARLRQDVKFLLTEFHSVDGEPLGQPGPQHAINRLTSFLRQCTGLLSEDEVERLEEELSRCLSVETPRDFLPENSRTLERLTGSFAQTLAAETHEVLVPRCSPGESLTSVHVDSTLLTAIRGHTRRLSKHLRNHV